MQGRYQANGGGMTQDERNLVEVLLSIDAALPHDFPLPEDAPRPAWCHLFMLHFGTEKGECCGICPELSEVMVQALDRVYEKSGS